MKITDALGNTMQPGDLLLWQRVGCVCKVKDITTGVELPTGNGAPKRTMGKLVIEVEMRFDSSQSSAQFAEFFRVVNPASEAIVEALAASGGRN